MATTITATIGGLAVGSQAVMAANRPLLKASMKAVGSELGFVTSQLNGIKISCDPNQFKLPSTALSVPFRPSLQPVAKRVCPLTGKKSNKANKVSHSNHKTKRLQFVNLQYKRVWWEAGKRYVKLRLSTKAMKTIEKNGLDAVAKKAGINLSKE
ncbi:large ribosomal subunit protein bL28c [Coffea arabica]|uniref:Large ribosomal subunit protein bL28c n=1 Tax=Coffea arabica TaxID=13443 RepID=A0A6P6WVD6_COFAR